MTMLSKRGFAQCLAVCAIITTASSVCAAEIKMIASMALHETYLELVPLYEKASGDKVTIVWSPAVQVGKRVEAGEKAGKINSLNNLCALTVLWRPRGCVAGVGD